MKKYIPLTYYKSDTYTVQCDKLKIGEWIAVPCHCGYAWHEVLDVYSDEPPYHVVIVGKSVTIHPTSCIPKWTFYSHSKVVGAIP